ncbi:MAG TPA: ABC transporter permease [Steroidobacteraceae bacterium]|jgi:putative ABC transport system permease protein|nr:ABC transporter permease [Steroidobacteraceae bacterium]
MLRQVFAITRIGIESIPQRWAPSLVIVIGLAGVVGVFTALLAMTAGFVSTLKATGRNDAAIIMRGGSDTELNSALTREQSDVIEQQPGITPGADGKPQASAELVVIAELIRRDDVKNGANITVRGVEPTAFALRPTFHIVAGRNFTPGLRELIVGRGVVRQFQGADVGKTIRMRGSDWTVVGEFETGDSHESELWADVNVARTTFGRSGSSSVLVALDGPDGLSKLKAGIGAEPRLTVDALREQEYFSGQTKQFREQIGFLATLVTVIMGLGAIFAALNSMYAAVAARGKEIATLRAIGFGGLPVLASVMVEALLLALAGGVLGAVIAYLLFNNLSVSTLGQNFTQVVFNFKVTPALVLQGLIIALVIGMIGGFLPALRAARLPVTTSLREQ